MKKIFLTILIAFLLIPNIAFAVGNLGSAVSNLQKAGEESGADESTVSDIAGTTIRVALTLVGIIFMILMVYAGYLWMTARGEEESVKKAQQIITAAIIGMVIVLSAYAITLLVTSRLGEI